MLRNKRLFFVPLLALVLATSCDFEVSRLKWKKSPEAESSAGGPSSGTSGTGSVAGGTGSGGTQPGTGAPPVAAPLDFDLVDNGNLTATVTARLANGLTAGRYSWNTPDQVGVPGETATLTFQRGGSYTITLYADVNGNWQNPLSVSKSITIGQSPSDRLLLFTKTKDTPDYMYFAVKVKGSSHRGAFRQDLSSASMAGYAYARDLHTQVYEPVALKNNIPTEFSDFKGIFIENYGLNLGGYNKETGFANKEGTSFEFPFYYGDDNYRIKNTGGDLSFTFKVFNIQDSTKPGILGNLGCPTLISMRANTELTITISAKDLATFNPDIHENIALLTVNFENYHLTSTDKPVITFDGFVEK